MKPECSKNRTLCVWLPNWPVERVRSDRPELRSREVVLFAPLRGALRVVACAPPQRQGAMPTALRGHAAAQTSGIAIGMPLAEATSLAPAAHFEQHDPQADRAALEQLACWCEEFSPIVGIHESDTLCLDATGLGPLFGGEEALMRQAVRGFARRGLAIRAAMADTLGAAWGLAHFGRQSAIIVPPGRTAAALAELPIAALRLEAEVEILAELGIQQVGQLLQLPRLPSVRLK